MAASPRLDPEMQNLDDIDAESRRRGNVPFTSIYSFPWWLLFLIILGIMVVVLISRNQDYTDIFNQLRAGIGLTIYLALASYALALVIGLLTGMIRSVRPKPPERGMPLGRSILRVVHLIVYNLITFYIEIMRGLPTLVFLLVAGFIIVPAIVGFINESIVVFLRDLFNNPDIPDLVWRGRDAGTAIAGLALVYGAFLSEIFRAGIQSVERGQVEAARSLGMTYAQVMRYVVIPQAVRRILPPLGNDFVAMIKDTSLVTILGTQEITQLARRWSGSTFQYLETYLVLCMIYLTMTISGSLLVQLMERYLRQHERN